eukprot:comp11632_c0_seq1/m.6138 comp11632_c0_seq1/g.6138  ORF comp11632_c0_seq1/g.6138 comp11632_c0_seq1/m.6138 type:complete len:307 (+) comp11632_c0_seq1:463-1383(+)
MVEPTKKNLFKNTIKCISKSQTRFRKSKPAQSSKVLMPCLVPYWPTVTINNSQLLKLAVDGAANQQPSDLAGAGTNLIQFGIAQNAASRVVVDVTVAAKDLDGLQSHLCCRLGRVENHTGTVLAADVARITCLGHVVDVCLIGIQGHVHVRQLALHQLELANTLAKLLTGVGIGEGNVAGSLHQTEGPTSQDQSLEVQAAHQHIDTLIDLPKYVLLGHLAVLENQLTRVGPPHAQLVELLGSAEPLETLLDEECGDTALVCLHVGLCIDHKGVGIGPVGDPELVAVEHIAVPLLLSTQLHGHDVGP